MEKLKAEIGVLIWNLAGCSTYALGYCLDEAHDTETARAALNDVKKLALKYRAERETSRKLADAGKSLRTWVVAYNEQIANGGRAASGAIAEFDEALELCDTPGHSLGGGERSCMSNEVKATILAVVLPLIVGGILYLSLIFPPFWRVLERAAVVTGAFVLGAAVFACWWSVCYGIVGGGDL